MTDNISSVQLSGNNILRILNPHRFIVGMVYRPPNANINEFMQTLENILEVTSAMKLPCYIMGDFNINLL